MRSAFTYSVINKSNPIRTLDRGKNLQSLIKVRVLPRSSVSQLLGMEEGIYRIKLAAPPVEGRANRALQTFLAWKLGIPKRNVVIVSGERSRVKLIEIRGLPQGETHRLLQTVS